MNKMQRLDQLNGRMKFARGKAETELTERKRTQAWLLFRRCFVEMGEECKKQEKVVK
jgi:hypothetical protein